MELARIILGVSGVLILAFAWPAWQRERQRRFQPEPERKLDDPGWKGSGIDVSGVTSRLRRLREDYLIEVHARPASQPFHESLLVVARHAVARLSFFASRRADELPHEHENNAA